MIKSLSSALRPALALLIGFSLLLGIAYPLSMTAIGQVIFPYQAGGSLIFDKGRVVGSELIGQNFTSAGYFHGRPSAAGAGYDASASSGSNLGPGSAVLKERVATSISEIRASGVTGAIPADLVTTSASGLDPHISPEAAFSQIARVAKARGIGENRLIPMVKAAIEQPIGGFMGEYRVNVLLLNRQLDAMSAIKGK